MVITYLGGQFVKVQFGETTLAVNPPSKDSKFKSARFGADVVLACLNHPDFNGVPTVTHGSKEPFAILGPGEYEVKDIVVRGFATGSSYGGERRVNTVYEVTMEGIKLLFLGALSSGELPAALAEELDEIDVLFLPVAEKGVLSPQAAEKLSVALEPRLVIPLPFEELAGPEGPRRGGADGAGKNALRQFLKEAGEEKTVPQEKLVLKRKDLEGKEGEVIVLKPAQ